MHPHFKCPDFPPACSARSPPTTIFPSWRPIAPPSPGISRRRKRWRLLGCMGDLIAIWFNHWVAVARRPLLGPVWSFASTTRGRNSPLKQASQLWTCSQSLPFQPLLLRCGPKRKRLCFGPTRPGPVTEPSETNGPGGAGFTFSVRWVVCICFGRKGIIHERMGKLKAIIQAKKKEPFMQTTPQPRTLVTTKPTAGRCLRG